MSAIDRLMHRPATTIRHTVVAPKVAGPQKPSRVFSTSSIKVAPAAPVVGQVVSQTRKFDVMAHLEAKRREGMSNVNKVGFSSAELDKLRKEYEAFLKDLETMEPAMFFTQAEPAPEPKAEPETPAEPAPEPEPEPEPEPAPVAQEVEPLVQGISVGDEAPVDTVIVTKKSRRKKNTDVE